MNPHNDEIMPICIRFIDQHISEFLPLERKSCRSIAEKLEEFYLHSNPDMQEIPGQYYDGSSNMASRKKELSGRVLNKNKKAIYTHCHFSSHVLNLSI